jgi:predicted O-methyltransferase YrrM
MPSLERMIWNKFHVHRGDNVPYVGWNSTRVVLAELFAELNFNQGAEIGVRIGEYSEVLCQKNPNLHLYCIDPWTPYSARGNAETQESNYKLAVERLSKYNTTILKKTSMDALENISDGSLDFVYIDGLHDFENVMLDIIHWSHKVRSGGIVSGHDYCWGYQGGVVPAVDAYTRGKGILNWHITREKEPSWFWAKP